VAEPVDTPEEGTPERKESRTPYAMSPEEFLNWEPDPNRVYKTPKARPEPAEPLYEPPIMRAQVSPHEPPMSAAQEASLALRQPSQRANIRAFYSAEFEMPSKERRQDLVRQGYLKPEEIDDEEAVRRVWESTYVRAASTPARHVLAAEGARKRGIWHQTYTHPVIKRVDTALPLVALAGGGTGIDYKGYKEKLFRETVQHLARVHSIEWRTASDVQKRWLEAEAESVSTAAFAQAVNRYRGVPWVDAYGTDVTAEIMELPAVIRPLAAVMRPVTWTEGGILTPGELKMEGALSQFGRLAPTTGLAAMIRTGESWGHERTIEEVRRGADIFQVLPQLGDLYLNYIYEDGKAPLWMRKSVGASIAIPLILIEPDPISLSLGVAGAGARIGKVYAETSRMGAKAAIGQEGLNAYEAGKASGREFMRTMRNSEAPEVRQAFEHAVAGEIEARSAEVMRKVKAAEDELGALTLDRVTREEAYTRKHAPEAKGGDPKGVDATTMDKFRRENDVAVAAKELEKAELTLLARKSEADEALEFLKEAEDLEEIGTSGQKAQRKVNAQLKRIKQEIIALEIKGQKAKLALDKARALHFEALEEIPEIAAMVQGGIKLSGEIPAVGGAPHIAAARVREDGDVIVRILTAEGETSNVLRQIGAPKAAPEGAVGLRLKALEESLEEAKKTESLWAARADEIEAPLTPAQGRGYEAEQKALRAEIRAEIKALKRDPAGFNPNIPGPRAAGWGEARLDRVNNIFKFGETGFAPHGPGFIGDAQRIVDKYLGPLPKWAEEAGLDPSRGSLRLQASLYARKEIAKAGTKVGKLEAEVAGVAGRVQTGAVRVSPELTTRITASHGSVKSAEHWFDLEVGKKIEELGLQRAMLETAKEDLKKGGLIRGFFVEARAAEKKARKARTAYNKAQRGLTKAERASSKSIADLQKSIKEVGRLGLKIKHAEELKPRAVAAMQAVIDSMLMHNKYIKKRYGGWRGATTSWDELNAIGAVYKKGAQIVAGKAIAASFKRVGRWGPGEEQLLTWDPQKAQSVLIKAYPKYAPAEVSGEVWGDLVRLGAQDLTKAQAAQIQDIISNTVMVIETKRATEATRVVGAMIWGSWQDLGVASRGDRLQKVGAYIKQLRRKTDYVEANVGAVGEGMADGLRLFENTLDLAQKEVFEVTSRAKNPLQVLRDYIDKPLTEISLKEGKSLLQVLLKGELVWDAGLRGIASASYRDPAEVADFLFRATTKREGALKQVQNAVAEEGLVDIASIEKLVGDLTDEGLVHALSGLGEVNLMIKTLGYAWVATGTKAAPRSEALLRSFAIDLIKKGEGTFDDFTMEMKKRTLAVFGDVASDEDGVRKSAMAVLAGVAHDRLGTHVKQMAGGLITMDEGRQLNRVLSGETTHLGSEGLEAAARASVKMGLPFTEDVHRIVQNGQKIQRKLVEIGENVIVPKALMDAVEESYRGYVKDLTALARLPTDQPVLGIDFTSELISAWKVSTITGVAVPNVRYWTNNIVGDFSQMWAEVGVARSGLLSFQNVLTNFGAPGRRFQEVLLNAAEGLDKAGRKAGLPSVTEVFFNPALGRFFRGEDGFFVSKGNRVTQFSEARKWLTDDGILDTFVHEEVLKYLTSSRLVNSPFMETFKKAKGWQRSLSEQASIVQQRQRSAFYLDLIQRGATRAEAKKRTLSALYDWKHGLARKEMDLWIVRMIPFYRFWRLAMKQATGAAIEPFTRPAGEYMARALTGRTRLARARQQVAITSGLPDLFFGGDPDEAIGHAEQMDELYKRMYPRWMDSRAILGAAGASTAKRQWLRDNLGKEATHTAYILPPFTMLDSFAMANAGLTLMTWAYEKAAPWRDPSERPDEMDAMAFEPLLGMTFPPLEMAFRWVGDRMGLALSYSNRSDYRTLTPAEERILGRFEKSRALMIPDEDTGKMKIPVWAHLMMRTVPVLGTQAPYLAGGVATNPYMESGGSLLNPLTYVPKNRAAWEYAFRYYTRFGAEYHYDAPKQAEYELKALAEKMSRSPHREELAPEHTRLPEERRYPLPPDVK